MKIIFEGELPKDGEFFDKMESIYFSRGTISFKVQETEFLVTIDSIKVTHKSGICGSGINFICTMLVLK